MEFCLLLALFHLCLLLFCSSIGSQRIKNKAKKEKKVKDKKEIKKENKDKKIKDEDDDKIDYFNDVYGG